MKEKPLLEKDEIENIKEHDADNDELTLRQRKQQESSPKKEPTVDDDSSAQESPKPEAKVERQK